MFSLVQSFTASLVQAEHEYVTIFVVNHAIIMIHTGAGVLPEDGEGKALREESDVELCILFQ